MNDAAPEDSLCCPNTAIDESKRDSRGAGRDADRACRAAGWGALRCPSLHVDVVEIVSARGIQPPQETQGAARRHRTRRLEHRDANAERNESLLAENRKSRADGTG